MADDVTPQHLEALAKAFDDLANSRMRFGQEKYGDFTWMEAPTFQMVLEELADEMNYIRFSAVKIMLVANWLADQIGDQPDAPMGNEGFQATNPERN
jgi:hypothetical protein